MFTFNTNNAKESNPTSNYLPVGIQENCTLKTFEIREVGSNGKKIVTFEFEQEGTAATAKMDIWFPNLENPYQRDGESVEEAVQREINKAMTSIIHIVEVVGDYTLPNVTGNSFEEWVNNVFTNFKAKTKKPVRVKLLYSKNGYVEFSRVRPFVETMEIEKSATRMSYTKYEIPKLTPPTPPAETVKPKEENIDDLPF